MKTVVICNPNSRAGGLDNLEPVLRQKLAAEELEFKTTTSPGQATAIARTAVQGNADMIVAVGGDGTVHEVLNGVVGSRARLAVIPAGTANDLARYYHLPGDIDKAADMIREHRTCRPDVIQVNDRYYLTAGGVGFPSLVASIANSMKSRPRLGRFLGRLLSSRLYVVAALWAIFSGSKEKNIVRVGSNGNARTEDIFSLTINNQPFLGKNFLVAPGAANDDGQLDVCLIQNSKNAFRRLLIVLRVLAGRHVNLPSVKLWRTDHLCIKAEKPLPFLGDGEIIRGSADFDIHVVQGAVNFVVPAPPDHTDIHEAHMGVKNSIKPPRAVGTPLDKENQGEGVFQEITTMIAPAPGFMRRMKVYLREMFPLGPRLAYATLFYFAFVLLLARVHGQRLAILSFWSILGIWDMFAILLILRLMDELKDRRTDLELFRERPLPSGRVLASDISFSLAVVAILYLAANSLAGPGFWTAAGVLAYAFLMFKYFFMPGILRRHLLLNLATHNPITALVLIHTVCLFSLQAGLPLQAIRRKPVLFLIAMNWALVFAWEISRKIRSGVEENAYVTYSQIFGRAGAVVLAGGAQTLAFALSIYFSRELRLSWLAVAVLVVGYGATMAGHLRFLARPSPRTARLKPFAERYIVSVCLAVISDVVFFP